MCVFGSSGISRVGESLGVSFGTLSSWELGGSFICWSTCMVGVVCRSGERSEDVVIAWEDDMEARSEASVARGGIPPNARVGICASVKGEDGGGRGRVGGENCSRRWLYGRALH